MLMPFGKYKGHDLSTLTDDYLLWLVANIPLRDPLLSAVAQEITERGWDLPPPAAPITTTAEKIPRDRGGRRLDDGRRSARDYCRGFPHCVSPAP